MTNNQSIPSSDQEMTHVSSLPDKPQRLSGKSLLAGLFLVLLCLLGWMQLSSAPLRNSSETAALTEPLLDDQLQIDYSKALEKELPADMTGEKNAFAVLVREIGVNGFSELFNINPTYKQRFYERLGLSPETPPKFKWISLDTAMTEYLAKTYPGESGLHLRNARWALFKDPDAGTLEAQQLDEWNREADRFCRKWYEENANVLAALTDAFKKSELSVPFSEYSSSLALLRKTQETLSLYLSELADIFLRRANYELADGKLEMAMQSILLVRRMAHLMLTSKPRFIETDLAALKMDKKALLFNFSAHPKVQPNREFWEKYNRESQVYFDRDFGEASIQNEFAFAAFPLLQSISKNREEAKLFDIPISSWLGYDWNRTGQTLDQFRNDLPQAMTMENDTITSPEKTRLKRRYMSMFKQKRSQLLAWDICHGVMPRMNAFREAFCMNRCLENMQRITIALELYRLDNKTYPPAYTQDAQGKPLQSWRVLLLPYLGEKEKALYDQIKRNEPWNSPANKKFHDLDLPIYACPSAICFVDNKKVDSTQGMTTYVVVVGKDSFFDSSGKGKPLPQTIPEETKLNPFPGILVAERHLVLCWMNPNHEILEKDLFRGVNCTASRLRRAGYLDGDPGPIKDFPPSLDSQHRGVVVIGLPNGGLKFMPQTLGGAL